MSGYRTVIVGTDGSDSSMRAVERAGAFAAQENAKLIVATAHVPGPEKGGAWAPLHDHVSDTRAEDALGREGYKVHGDAAVYDILHDARSSTSLAPAALALSRASWRMS